MYTYRLAAAAASIGLVLASAVVEPASARAAATAYLVNVTVRPGYHFSGADDALQYGFGLCGDVADGHPYAALIGRVKADMQTGDDYQAAYLINQAVNELCPAQIWQLRNSAAGYHVPIGPS